MSDFSRGCFWMLGAVLSFSSMAIAGREAMGALDTFELMTYRSMIGIVVIFAVLTTMGRWGDVSRARFGTHVLRNIMHFSGQNLWFLAISIAPLAQVVALEFTSPIWLVLMAPALLGEPLTRRRLMAVVLGFCGILLVARPEADGLNLGMLAAAGSAIFFALTNITTKRLTRTEGTFSILFWLTAIQLVFGLVCAGWDGAMRIPPTETMPYLVIVGLCGLSAHLCLTNALALAPAAQIVPIDFLRLPLVALLGWWLYQERIDVLLGLGALLIIAGNYLNIVVPRQQNREQT